MATWTLTTPSPEFLAKVKQNEGSMAYQQKKGYFKNGKFWVYKDSLGFPTIGYGHLVTPKENFKEGITADQADALLIKDCGVAIGAAKSIADQYNINAPLAIQEMLVEMVFQLGKDGVLKFKKFLTALSAKDYPKAIVEVKDSLWYKQTPNRVEGHIKVLNEQRGR